MLSRYPIKKQPQKQTASSNKRLLQQHDIASQHSGAVQAPRTEFGNTYHLPPLVLTPSAAKPRPAQPKPSAQKFAPAVTKLPPLVSKPSSTMSTPPQSKNTEPIVLPSIYQQQSSEYNTSATGSSSELSSGSLFTETDAAHTSTTAEQTRLNDLFDKYDMSSLKQYQNEFIRLEPKLEDSERHPDWENSNCHGYTFYEDTSHFIDALEFIDEYLESDSKNVAVFLRGNEIAHSGIIEGTHLRHLLMGIGIIKTPIGPTDTLGYNKRFNLPEDLELLMPYQELMQIRANMCYDMGQALAKNLFTIDELAFLGDMEQGYETIYNKMHDKIDEFLSNEDAIISYIQSKSEPQILQIYRRIAQLS